MHEKFTRKNGKTYGPYLYENKRVDGKVVTQYIGQPKRNRNRNFYFVFGMVFVIVLFLALYYIGSPTSKVTFDINFVYKMGEQINGDMKFRVKEGELVPKDSQVVVTYGNQSKTFPLSELVRDVTTNGNYYAEGADISGSGEGYGVEGANVIYPVIDFEMLIKSSQNEEVSEEGISEDGVVISSGGEGQVVIGDGGDVTSSEAPSETPSETAGGEITTTENTETSESETTTTGTEGTETETSSGSETSTTSEGSTGSGESASSGESSESSGDSGISESSGITGGAITEDEYVVKGQVSKGNDFDYNLEDGQTAEIISGSVNLNGSAISDSSISLQASSGKAIVSTNYFVNERGFGEKFLGDYGLTLQVDAEELGLYAEPGTMKVELVYDGKVIASQEEYINTVGEVSRANITLPLLNETEIESNITSNLSLVKEIPTIRIGVDGSSQLDLIEYFDGADRYEFEGGNITADFDSNLMTLTPDSGFKGARKAKVIAFSGGESLEGNEFNVLVSSGNVKITTTREQIRVGELVRWTKNVSSENPEALTIEIPASAENISVKKVEGEEVVDVTSTSLTGQVVIELNLEKQPKFIQWIKSLFRSITGRAVEDLKDVQTGTVDVSLDGSSNQYTVEYYTAAPIANETLTSEGKIVTISAPSDLNYTDVIASTELDNVVEVGQESKIKVYWYNYENTSIEVKNVDEVPSSEVVEDVIIEANGEFVGQESISEDNLTSENVSGGVLTGSLITGNAISEGEDVSNRSYVLQEVPFDAYDLDEDGNVDYIEWVVPHLSSQT